MEKAIALLGPTASGKSDMAITLAKKFNGEVVSCDSRQIYRGMDIGSGKVTCDQNVKCQMSNVKCYSEGIPHWMLDIVSPRTEYNVAKFQKRANEVIQDILKRRKLPILCGGTGFWAQALVENMRFPGVAPDKKLREKLNKKTALQLYTQLQKCNPDRARALDPHNKIYLIRALEIASATNLSLPAKEEMSQVKSRDREGLPLQWLITALNPPRKKLFANIEKRLDIRLKKEMIDEVYHLHFDHHVSWKRLYAFGLEYRWVSRYLRKKITRGEMREAILTDSRRYAKRQLTYLRRWEGQGMKIHWVVNFSEAEKLIQDFFKKKTR